MNESPKVSEVEHEKLSPEIMAIQNGEAVHLLLKKRQWIVSFSSSSIGSVKNNLAGIIASLPQRAEEEKKKKETDISAAFAPRTCTLLLTTDCNLRCGYCYANAGKEKSYLDIVTAEKAIKLVTDNAIRQRKNARVVLHAGGEPTRNWRVIVKSVKLARKIMSSHGLKASFSITTNGVLPESRAIWLAKNIEYVLISLDGPADIQNAQRPRADNGPSFQSVISTIETLQSFGKKIHIRTTLVAENIHRFEEIASFILSDLKADTLHVEPVSTTAGRCESNPHIQPPSQESFLAEFVRLSNDKRFSGKLINSHVSILRERFCGAAGKNFGITPKGDVSSCLEVISRDDPRANSFLYGHYDHGIGKFAINQESLSLLDKRCGSNVEGCGNSCFAEFGCAGDCLAKHADGNQESLFVHRTNHSCTLQKGILLDLLKRLGVTGDTCINLPVGMFSESCRVTLTDYEKWAADHHCVYAPCPWDAHCHLCSGDSDITVDS
jgi:uncharacterized protein